MIPIPQMRLLPFFLSLCACFLAAQDVTFKDEVKLVEIYATVFEHGRTVDGLKREQFEIRDDGRPQPIKVFEPSENALSCALLLDTTGSMAESLPALKNAARDFIDALRPSDSLGIYAFTDHVVSLQAMSTDRAASHRAVTRLRAGGSTALFDSISQVSLDLEQRSGKKVIVVLTDGGDNASVLNRQSASQRARKAGVPVFAIAQGDALRDPAATALLQDLAEATGGHMYKANRSKDIDSVFQAIARDLQSGYMLAFKAPVEEKATAWHELQVVVNGSDKALRVRARTGYPAE